MNLKLEEQWAEVLAVLFLVIGFILAILLQSATFTLISVFISGSLAARIFYLRRYSEPIFPFILIILGFLVGYLLGSFWVSRIWVLIFFGLAFGLSYYLHLKGIFATFKSKNFLK